MIIKTQLLLSYLDSTRALVHPVRGFVLPLHTSAGPTNAQLSHPTQTVGSMVVFITGDSAESHRLG